LRRPAVRNVPKRRGRMIVIAVDLKDQKDLKDAKDTSLKRQRRKALYVLRWRFRLVSFASLRSFWSLRHG
jgi:hypothetical protein